MTMKELTFMRFWVPLCGCLILLIGITAFSNRNAVKTLNNQIRYLVALEIQLGKTTKEQQTIINNQNTIIQNQTKILQIQKEIIEQYNKHFKQHIKQPEVSPHP